MFIDKSVLLLILPCRRSISSLAAAVSHHTGSSSSPFCQSRWTRPRFLSSTGMQLHSRVKRTSQAQQNVYCTASDSNKTPNDIWMRDKLERFAQDHSNRFKMWNILSLPLEENEVCGQHSVGRLDKDVMWVSSMLQRARRAYTFGFAVWSTSILLVRTLRHLCVARSHCWRTRLCLHYWSLVLRMDGLSLRFEPQRCAFVGAVYRNRRNTQNIYVNV